MRIIALTIAVALAALFAFPAASATHDPYEPLRPATDPVYKELRPVCAQVLKDLRDEGVLGNHSDHEEFGFESDYWANAPECAELRDEVQWQANAYGAIPPVEECNYIYGVSCIAVNHYACDFAFVVATGIVYLCLGGLNPEN